MIKLKLGELYGMDSIEHLMMTIKDMHNVGMTDEEIQDVLDRSETGSIHEYTVEVDEINEH